MCQYCEFKTERGAKAFIREGKERIYIRPMDKLNMGNIFITADMKNFQRSIDINFCPFCGRKLHKGCISYVQEEKQNDGSIIQIIKFKDNKPIDYI